MNVKQKITEMYEYIGINEFCKGYRVRFNLEKDENVCWFAESYSILNGRKNHLSQFLNFRAADNFRHMVGYTATLLVPELSVLNLVVTENVKK